MTMGWDREPTQWLEMDGCRLPYWRLGQGPDLVFVHGWPLDARTWVPVAQRLQAHFTCHLFDLPGAGRSVWEPGFKASVSGYGALVAQVLDALPLGGRRVGLVGQDSGGGMARAAAALRPERVCGMGLANTEIPGRYTLMLRLLFGLLAPRRTRGIVRSLLGWQWVRRLVFRYTVMDKALVRQLAQTYLEPLTTSKRAYRGATMLLDGLHVSDFDALEQAHRQISAPVKLIWGVEDPWFPLEDCRQMMGSFAGPVELVEIKGARLLIHEEHPERFARELKTHFDACFAAV